MVLPCRVLCKENLKRFHLTCLVCRFRRAHYGKLGDNFRDHARVEFRMVYDKRGFYVVPRRGWYYVLVVDGMRKRGKIKDALLKRILTLAEILAN
jgi:hypothetical protein